MRLGLNDFSAKEVINNLDIKDLKKYLNILVTNQKIANKIIRGEKKK